MTTPIDLLQQAASQGEEPGETQTGHWVQKASGNPDVLGDYKPPIIITDLESAGWEILYDTETREPSLCNGNAVNAQLQVKRANGLPVFTRVVPQEGPWRGNIKCFLHADQPERAKYNAMGFPQCRKATLPNTYQATLHAEHKHRAEWAAIKTDREENERQEERSMQRALLERLARGDLSVVTPMGIDSGVTEAIVDEIIAVELTKDPMNPAFRGPFKGIPRYFCGKCQKNHVETTRMGKSHRKHEVK